MYDSMEEKPTAEIYPCFVKVSEDENLENFIELPTEKDGSMLLSTIQGQFPNAIGVKYRSPSGSWRGIRLSDNVLDPPFEGWGDTVYSITLPKADSGKRKMEESPNREPEAKLVKTGSESEYLSDLIVLGLPYKAREDDVKDYFQQFGELVMHEIKYDPVTKKSRGFAFIRYKTIAAAQKALKSTHNIMGRRCEVRLPDQRSDAPRRKLFVGRLPEDTTQDELDQYFQKFGELTDVYIPTPFRRFGFVTFALAEVAREVLLQGNHTLKGVRLNVTHAEPKDEKGGKSSRNGRSSSSRSSSRRHQDPPFDFKDMREVMYSSRAALPQSSIPYVSSSRRTPPREVRDVHDNRLPMTYPHTVSSYNDYPQTLPTTYAPNPDIRTAYSIAAPPPAQHYDSRELQYSTYWSTSK